MNGPDTPIRLPESLAASLRRRPRTWLVSGVAGFIGSNLLEALLQLDQPVVGLDNFATGKRANLEQVRSRVQPQQWARFRFLEGDICDPDVCRRAVQGIEVVLHQAALGSVPRSIEAPLKTHAVNVTGFIHLLVAARDAGVRRFVYASSSAVYGDAPELPKTEERLGRPLSPYAASKRMNEIYAETFSRVYGMETIGLRYFNVFGPRQDPEGPYAAVIPQWIAALLRRQPVFINGDGETSRDFCPVENVVQANLRAATTDNPAALNQIFNIALGRRTTLNDLFALIQNTLRRRDPGLSEVRPVYRDFRPGDVRHSLADISKARSLLGYEPTCDVEEGLERAMEWYRRHLG